MIIPSKHNGFTRDGVRRLYISSGKPAASQPTTTITESGPTVTNRTTANEIPKYLTNASQDLVARGAALTSTPYEGYTGKRVADFTPDLLTAMDRTRNQGVAGEINEASGLAGLAGKRASDYGMFSEGVKQYMNPYMQGVVDVEGRKAQEKADRESSKLSGQAAVQGAFGGSGAALQQRALRRDTAQQLADIQSLGLNKAYENATNQYNTGITNMLSASGQLGTLGTTRFGQETDITKNLALSGDVQRQRDKELLDVDYNEFIAKKKDPYEKLAFQQGLVSGVPYSTTQRVNEVSQPGKQVSQQTTTKEKPNEASQLIGAGLTAYGALDGGSGDANGAAKGGVVKHYAAGGIAGLNQPQMASALQGMSDDQVANTAAMPGLPGLTGGGEQKRREDVRIAAAGQQAPASMTKITSILSQMSDAELQQYAKLNKSDPYTMALVVSEADRRKNGGMPNQGQPKVVDQKIASMALPEDQGIAQLPVNMEFASGGIIAFANGDEVPDPEEATSPFGDFFRGIGAFRDARSDYSSRLGSLRDRQAAAQQGIFEALTPTEKRARAEELKAVDREIAALEGGAPAPMAEGIGTLIMNDEARKRAPGQAEAVAAATAAAAAGQGAGPAPAPAVAGGAGGAGGMGGYSGIMGLYDQAYEARKKAEEDAMGIEEAAMTEERTAQQAAIEEAKKYGSDREERLKKRESGMKGEKDRNINTTFIEAGLAIMAGESSNALLNIAKGARLGLQGYEERLSKINASKEKLDDDFSRLYELRQEKVGAAGEKLRGIDKEIAGLKANAKRTFGQLASDLAGQKINVSMKQLDNAAANQRASASTRSMDTQAFEQLVRENNGDAVKAKEQFEKRFGKRELPPGVKEGVTALEKKIADIIGRGVKLPDDDATVASLQRRIIELSGGSGASGGGSSGAPLPANPSAANLKVGTVYQTARGPAKWTGTGFAPI